MKTKAGLMRENATLRARLEEAEETLRAIRAGEVDALRFGQQIHDLKGAETPYRLLIESMNEGAATLVANGTVGHANRRLAEMLRVPPEELIGRPLREFIDPGDLAAFDALLTLGRQGSGTQELRLHRSNASPLPLKLSCSSFGGPKNPSLFLVATDLTEIKRTEDALRHSNRALRTLSSCSQSMVHAKSEPELLTAICQALVDEGGYALAWVGIGEHDEAKTVRCVAQAGKDDGYIANTQITWADTKHGRGPTGATLRTGGLMMCNTQTHPEFAPWRADALRHGFASSICLPLDVTDEMPVALSIYSGETDAFNDDEVQLLIELASDLSYGINTLRARAKKIDAETALKESEQAFRTLAESMPQIVWTTRPDGWNTYFNQHWVDYTGLTLEESYGHGWNTPFHPDDQKHAWEAWNLATQTGGTYSLEVRLRRKDGVYRWWLVRGEPQRDAEGKIIKWFGTCTDIHDLKEAEMEIRSLNVELEQRVQDRTHALNQSMVELETILKTVPIGLAIADEPDSRHIRGNPALEQMLGVPRGSELSQGAPTRPAYRVLSDGHELPIDQMPNQRAGRGETVTGQFIDIVRADGRTLNLYSCAAPLLDEAGRPRGSVGAFLDITELKKTEEALRQSERVYRAIGESIDYGVWMCAPDGRNIYASESFLKLVGLTQQQCSDFGWGEVLHPDDSERTMDAWKECVTTGGIWDIEHRFRGVEGQWHPILARGVPVKDEQGNILCWAGINLDISRLKKSEQAVQQLNLSLTSRAAELEAANHELESFSYSVSHDLRAPLRSIDGFSRIVLSQHAAELSPEAREALEVVRASAQQMGRLIDDLLVFSRLSRQPLRKQPVMPNKLVKACLDTLRPESEGRHVDIVIGELPVCEADPGLLQLVWMNLLSNSLKYTRKRDPARVEIGALQREGETVYFVRDNGVGFQMAYAQKLFGVFQRLHRAEDYEGTGVGLATAQHIVHRHGGRIWAESEPEKGATFFFTLDPNPTP